MRPNAPENRGEVSEFRNSSLDPVFRQDFDRVRGPRNLLKCSETAGPPCSGYRPASSSAFNFRRLSKVIRVSPQQPFFRTPVNLGFQRGMRNGPRVF